MVLVDIQENIREIKLRKFKDFIVLVVWTKDSNELGIYFDSMSQIKKFIEDIIKLIK